VTAAGGLATVVRVPEDVPAVQAANAAFYEAFERSDVDAMAQVWERSDRAACTHPGWQRLSGWEQVLRSWHGILRNGRPMQFILTQERVDVIGDVAIVLVDENIVGEGIGGTVAAVNLFARQADGSWRMIGHHGAPVARSMDR
jgi:ketosteroid isomerase-like protein